MESRLQRLFLALAMGISLSQFAYAEEENDDTTILEGVINPDIERRRIDESRIDSENFEFGFYAGVMSVEDFGSNNVYGGRAAFHITEDWFLETAIGSTSTSETSWEVLNGGGGEIIAPEDRALNYYNLSLGLNLLPGEVFIANDYAFNTSYFLIAGIGNTQFANDEFFTLNFGAGFRVFAADWLAARVGFRNHLFTHNALGVEKSVQNLEAHMGLSIYF